ncbi:helix-turn-helix domain-containing protein [Burkholderia sp. BE24]|nr:helix-turn-helix domain-containing protein [Burkholderia sp. BE24]
MSPSLTLVLDRSGTRPYFGEIKRGGFGTATLFRKICPFGPCYRGVGFQPRHVDAAAETKTDPPAWVRYAASVARVHAYIGAHLDGPLDLNRLAEIACLSPYHWQRIYRAMYGESIVLMVRRMRMVRASEDLVCTARPLDEIARRAGVSRRVRRAARAAPAQRHPPADLSVTERRGRHVQA